ncbi:glycosyltransferase family 9 protein [Flavobacterium sp. GT3R68]|uniref:glycosyltransferase family 9 protein n=1 Tax=Flavobacterium sp. GT3R68 TaxID=2594437 RepID=UPI000F889C34|nr:glycosyltransferase family 9 protein [Flavobacterium sp. GT3R68]RTY95929.1 lipopolysaccharide heptosyltransferase family protein [Flavobacterium sp. GSN2]TRW93701.1 glycosyltransferase family 9 protein [Flavobacterium sp. GT3R68]
MRLSAMGDVAMTVPVIRAFVTQNPDVRITFISRHFYKPFFEEIPNVDFFAFDAKGRHKGFLGLVRLFQDLKPLKIDAFADLHNVLRSKVVRNLFAASGKKTASVDKGRKDKAALTRAENKVFQPLITMFERHAQVFSELGFAVNLLHPQFPPKQKMAPEIIALVGEKNQKWIGIAPFAQYDSKVYPLDLLQRVISDLSKNNQYKILLFGGGANEIQILNSLSDHRENVITVAGKITFRQELQLISNLNLMVSMDSGNAHIAAMLGIEVMTLWGATHPYAGFSPFHQPLENALVSDREQFPMLPTSVYGNKMISGYEDAMRSIDPKKVVYQIITLLQ